MRKKRAKIELSESELYLGKVLEWIRTIKKVTQDDLCAKSGVSRSSISAYERGARNPKASNLRRITDALDIDFDLLLESTAVQWHASGSLKQFDPESGELKVVKAGGIIAMPPPEKTAHTVIEQTDVARKNGPFQDEWEKRLVEHYRALSDDNKGKVYDFILSLKGS